jgi:hypothetical protein
VDSQAADIVTWAEQQTQHPPSCKPKAKRLTQAEVGLLIQLHKDGKTQQQIAQLLGVTQQAIAKWLDNVTDTTETAKLYLRGSALRMAQNIVAKGRAADHVAALKGLSVLQEERAAGLVVQIGIKDSDVQVTLSPPANTQAGEGQ